MIKNLEMKALIIAIVVGIAFMVGYPPLDTYDKDGKLLEKGKVNLGLDLQGGMYVVVRVDIKGMEEKEAERTVERAELTIRNRIDKMGLKEPLISRIGTDRILIQLPGVTNRDDAIDVIRQVAHLEFRMVSRDPDLIKKALAGDDVEGYKLMAVKDSPESAPLLVSDKVELTGSHIVSAEIDFNNQAFGQTYVSFTLDPEGGKIFSKVTSKNIRERLAIILDGILISAPTIQTVIPNGRGRITGHFSRDEAAKLANMLESGALPAPVEIIEERTVGPTLGKDSIRKGIRAILIGGLAVLVFMALYYLLSGLIADFALVLNLILITGALAYFHGTLTLPGIAGLVLTIGMAVDANVLIFERIREESDVGKSIRAAIKGGFRRAFLTIIDSNVTTLIAAVVLFKFGSGPVKGFATILWIGILSSMFTALVVTRLVLEVITSGKRKFDRLPMLRLIKNPKINFIKFRKIAYVISLAIIVIGLFTFAQNGEKNYGIDFTGGTIQQFRFDNPIKTESIRDILKGMGLGQASIQAFGNDKEVIIRSFEMNPSKINAEFKKSFAGNNFEVMRVEKVGPSVGKDLRGKAVKALIFAMICMVIYISIRFEVRFAVAAIIALLHDVAISVGMLCLTGRELSTPVIAALLTIVGYSINDTIVVFDRIREDRKLMRKSSQSEIINASINQTLSRTLLTSLTTFAVVLALFLFGGEVINDFAFVLMVGVIAGTYSSIFIASPIILDWPSRKVVRR